MTLTHDQFRRIRRRRDIMSYGAGAVLASALLLGGGGAAHDGALLIVELVALVAIAAFLAWPSPSRARMATVPLLLLGLTAALMVVQLIPLPAPWWRALPGRELAIAILDSVGAGGRAHPVSLDPAATARALAGLLPGAAMLLLTIRMDLDQRIHLIRFVIVCALLSLGVGLVQFLSDGIMGTLYREGHVGYATGLFANRNHQASLLLIAIALTSAVVVVKGAWPEIGRPAGRAVQISLTVALAAGIVATTSRAGLLLLPVALYPLFRLDVSMRWQYRVLAALLLCLVAYLVFQWSPTVRLVVDRLSGGNMSRLQYWRDLWPAIVAYWPVGSGFGTFPAIFKTVEPLKHIGPNYVNHAHNDYLELLLEGGAPAALLLTAGIVWWWRRAA